jgi:hypothetical protein
MTSANIAMTPDRRDIPYLVSQSTHVVPAPDEWPHAMGGQQSDGSACRIHVC